MRRAHVLTVLAVGTVLLAAGNASAVAPGAAPAPRHHPRFMLRVDGKNPTGLTLTPPAPPCPIPNGAVPSVPDAVPAAGGTSVGPCVKLPQFPATGAPGMGNMAYWGGRVQVHPHLYLVYLGWGQAGAFKGSCSPERLSEGQISATLKCDPDGAGKRMADFTSQLGGTGWAQSQTQYYQVVNGVKTYIHNDRNQLAGIWVDDVNRTSAKISYHDMAAEAERAATHFHVPEAELINSNFVILQPQNFSDPIAQSAGYCAFHDFIRGDVDPKDYKGLKPGLPYTNMPYVLNQGTGCGENLVNAGPAGRLDGFTVALGHEIEETVTDPGAEDTIGQTPIGGWFDPFDGNENGDKCAYVADDVTGGYSAVTGKASTLPLPGGSADIRGNRGGVFPVQSLWSNDSAAGVGYCAGAGTDLPVTG